MPELMKQENRVTFSPMSIVQQAIEKGMTGAELNSLADFAERMQNREDRISFGDAMARFRDDIPVVVRSRGIKNKSGEIRYMAAALEDVAGPLMKALAAQGIMYRWKSTDLPDGRTRVTCYLRLKGTAYEEEGATLAAPPDTEGGKDALKAVGSTVSYLEKYTLMESCGFHVHGTDPEAVPLDGITNETGIDWIESIKEGQTPEETMERWQKAIGAAKAFTPIDYKAMTIFTEARDERLKELRRGNK